MVSWWSPAMAMSSSPPASRTSDETTSRWGDVGDGAPLARLIAVRLDGEGHSFDKAVAQHVWLVRRGGDGPRGPGVCVVTVSIVSIEPSTG